MGRVVKNTVLSADRVVDRQGSSSLVWNGLGVDGVVVVMGPGEGNSEEAGVTELEGSLEVTPGLTLLYNMYVSMECLLIVF